MIKPLVGILMLGVLMSMVATGRQDDAWSVNARLGRGINMGNMLEAPREGAWFARLKEPYFDLVKEAGFTSVRIPVRWSAHALDEAPYTIDAKFLKRVDLAVEQALARGLLVVLNVHHYNGFMEDPAAHEERLLGIWEQLSRHYRNQPRALCFEVLNEPSDKVTPEIWNRVQNKALKLIRKSNPDRIIFAAPLGWNRIGHLKSLELPFDDPNLIASVHFYEPFWFTHQGAGWVKRDIPVGKEWLGTDGQKAELLADLDEAARWSKEHGIPINVGEFGAYEKAGMESRARWTAFLTREMEKRGMSWNYWEFCSGFGVYDPDEKIWRTELLNALIPNG
ncbi:Endoglucanase H [Pontiella desulfatans]|uniref:Endoglucanase H n=2 Tax=Pontiella desulfatans TaxID=2750659 RepID=A0A6C2U5Y9_PONDE|nr:Endoglucanase H [Pontiella desulfatans]